jgi:hypothetical protein
LIENGFIIEKMISGEHYRSIFSIKNGGPSAKNGFRIEEYWAICRMFELFDAKQKDFYLLLDNISDVEHGLKNEDSICFDQVKSKAETRGASFSVSDLIRKDSNGHTIFDELESQAASPYVKDVTLVFNDYRAWCW